MHRKSRRPGNSYSHRHSRGREPNIPAPPSQADFAQSAAFNETESSLIEKYACDRRSKPRPGQAKVVSKGWAESTMSTRKLVSMKKYQLLWVSRNEIRTKSSHMQR